MKRTLRFFLRGILLLGLLLALPGVAFSTEYFVSIINFDFVPYQISIAAGDTVTWTNNDAVAHTSTSDTNVWDSGNLAPGQSYSFVFTTAGSYPYHCTYHPSMTGIVSVSATGIDDLSPSIPDKIVLSQNYPNPFNASTVLNFAIAQSSHVKLNVYNLLGQYVETLVDSRYEAGEYTISWNPGDLPSGVYFARLRAEQESRSIRMHLLK
jgi:plastocyanin